MASTRTWGLTSSQQAELWKRWKAGESLVEIAAALGKRASSVYAAAASRGGIAPVPRRRAERTLRMDERETISRGLAANVKPSVIAASLGRSPSTVSREIKRNGGADAYRAEDADAMAWSRSRRPKRCRLAERPRLRKVVASKLKQNWSPQQIASWLKKEFSDDPAMQVSHETIYRSLFVQTRGALKRELMHHLRRAGLIRRPRSRQIAGGGIVGAVSISERPAEVADRAVPGHWEGDLLIGANSSQIATLVERRTRYLMLVKIETKDSKQVAAALARKIRRLPAELRRSLTWDRGTEMAAHQKFSIASDVQVFFCDPRSPWQRGSNENTNGLLRQYYPKGKDLGVYSQAQLNKVAAQMNSRPRETLNWNTPAEALSACVATTG